MKQLSILATLAAVAAVPPVATPASAPDAGRPFEPKPVSKPLYGIKAPAEDPKMQRHTIRAPDGVDLYVETWLPKPQGAHVPPPRLPTVLVMSPYLQQGQIGGATRTAFETLVPRGYAFSQLHLRGTGESGGCIDFLGAKDIDDGARAVEYVGRDAPWSNGRVGAYGISHYGGSAVATAGRGDPTKTRYLKALFIGGPANSTYELTHQDGVPLTLPEAREAYLQQYSLAAGGEAAVLANLGKRAGCQHEHVIGSAEHAGDLTPYHAARDQRVGAANIRAATFLFHGLFDDNVSPLQSAGFFDRLPRGTPKAGMFGAYNHDIPDGSYREPPYAPREWSRADFAPMLTAWFDRYLKRLPSGARRWPTAQVQGTDGQWRAQSRWPSISQPTGQLALGPAGSLGVTRPTGATAYVEGAPENTQRLRPPGTAAVFETDAVEDRLEVTGLPVLEAWVSLNRPDAHLAARLEAIGPAGEPMAEALRLVGLRSMRHLDPLTDGRFAQTRGHAAPVDTPLRVEVRFPPADLVVPKGGKLRLTIAGSQVVQGGIEETAGAPVSIYEHPSAPSGAGTRVTILHDCDLPSVLRFEMPLARSRLLNVREFDEPAGQPLTDNRADPSPPVDGGGIATAPICGQPGN